MDFSHCIILKINTLVHLINYTRRREKFMKLKRLIQGLQVRASSYFHLNQPTRCSNFSSLLLVVQIQLNMFRASSCPSSGSTTTAVAASGLPSELGDSSAVGRGRAGRPDHKQQHCYHQAAMVNQRLLLQLLQILMMGMRMPETC